MVAVNRAETCKNGHPWTPETILTDRRGWRRCRICKRGHVAGPAGAPPRATCKRGHPMVPDNLYIRPDRGQRMCRECKSLNVRGPSLERKPGPRVYVQAPLLAFMRDLDLSQSDIGRMYAARFGVSERHGKRIVQRMLAEEALTLVEADRIAVTLGYHISAIWPEYVRAA